MDPHVTLLMPPTERMLRLQSRMVRATWCCLHLTPPLWLSGF